LTHPDKEIYRNGMEWDQKFKSAKVHIQWDPERTLKGGKLEVRSIQVGISRYLIEEYNNEWIAEISDLTPLTKKINALRKQGKYTEAKRQLPKERIYPLPEAIATTIGVR